jgi:hypothetical protein
VITPRTLKIGKHLYCAKPLTHRIGGEGVDHGIKEQASA